MSRPTHDVLCKKKRKFLEESQIEPRLSREERRSRCLNCACALKKSQPHHSWSLNRHKTVASPNTLANAGTRGRERTPSSDAGHRNEALTPQSKARVTSRPRLRERTENTTCTPQRTPDHARRDPPRAFWSGGGGGARRRRRFVRGVRGSPAGGAGVKNLGRAKRGPSPPRRHAHRQAHQLVSVGRRARL